MRPGDMMHWDFHAWIGSYHGSSAIIGSFPEPLVHGYEGQTYPTIVLFGDGFETQAAGIADGLNSVGVTGVILRAAGVVTETELGSHNLVLIADSGNDLVSILNDEHEPLGMYAYFDDGRLVVTDYRFRNTGSYGAGTGVVQASQNPWSPLGTGACRQAVFVVSGVDTAGVNGAVRVLLDSIASVRQGGAPIIANAFGVVITTEGNVMRTPH
jgi:hypothetical protein